MGRIPPWSDLPQELLSAIAERLHSNPVDVLRFRSVCRSWCSSSSLSLSSPPTTLFPPLPLTTPSPPNSLRRRYSSQSRNTTFLSVTVIYALRPPIEEIIPSWMSRVWLLFLDQSNPAKVSIRQPFSRCSYSLPINFPRNLNLLGFHASELGRFYNLTNLPNGNANHLTKPSIWSGLVNKVVVLSNGDGLAVVTLSDSGKLGLLRLGLINDSENVGAETEWEFIHAGKGFRFDDIVDFKGRVLGIDRRGRVYEIGIGNLSTTMDVIVPPIVGGGGRRKRLVASSGRLHLVVRCNVHGETDAMFKVYELNESTKKWVEVNSIGDRIFFLGLEFSFSASAEEHPGLCGRNCILFKEQSFLNYSGNDDDFKLFRNLGSSDLHIGVWRFEDAAHLGVIGSNPGYSNVLWPPPSWIWPKDKSERLGTLFTVLDQLQSRIPDEKLKAKFNELSPPQQEGALALMREALKMKELLNQIREMDKKMKVVEMISVSLQQGSNSVNLHNQAGTSTLGTEDMYAPVDSLLKTNIHNNCEYGWFSLETNLNGCILKFEESTSKLEDALKRHKFSAIVNST